VLQSKDETIRDLEEQVFFFSFFERVGVSVGIISVLVHKSLP
jgi:hypothetical protein